MVKNVVPWSEKISKAYFRGMPTGKYYDEDGNFIQRVKLVNDTFEYDKNFTMTDIHFVSLYPMINYYKEFLEEK